MYVLKKKKVMITAVSVVVFWFCGCCGYGLIQVPVLTQTSPMTFAGLTELCSGRLFNTSIG